MKLFVFDQICRKLQGRLHILRSDPVFILNFRRRHTPCEATDNARNRNSRAANYGASVLNVRIDRDTFVH